jgi:hypothetical protein
MAADNTDSFLVVGFADPAPVIGELVTERDSACLERFTGPKDASNAVLSEVINAGTANRSDIVRAVLKLKQKEKASKASRASIEAAITNLLEKGLLVEISPQRGNKPSVISWPCLPPSSELFPQKPGHST